MQYIINRDKLSLIGLMHRYTFYSCIMIDTVKREVIYFSTNANSIFLIALLNKNRRHSSKDPDNIFKSGKEDKETSANDRSNRCNKSFSDAEAAFPLLSTKAAHLFPIFYPRLMMRSGKVGSKLKERERTKDRKKRSAFGKIFGKEDRL